MFARVMYRPHGPWYYRLIVLIAVLAVITFFVVLIGLSAYTLSTDYSVEAVRLNENELLLIGGAEHLNYIDPSLHFEVTEQQFAALVPDAGGRSYTVSCRLPECAFIVAGVNNNIPVSHTWSRRTLVDHMFKDVANVSVQGEYLVVELVKQSPGDALTGFANTAVRLAALALLAVILLITAVVLDLKRN
jgi:hypothetical protein